ncbi:pyridoxamine 5'-phosphate oxidase [Robiginitalea sp. SC105]|uniref:pyridoxamine 5'-phosphate oxidase n=1 Tax=Robiginitalea sp. SC105 TaxID=2762332 RepID=UPI00163A08AA|nr:pyridoxamine 5'-phosphate oxidase [Robiginitalea sp. SC105]MBC2840208.1 pyridoxamine 5'-phosphate oxidase [Robiginitalea sp. SC105]
MEKDLGTYRKSYEKRQLIESEAPEEPFALFAQWFRDAEAAAGGEEPNAMTLATMGPDGFPKNRVVLLKKFSPEGFVFYTNYTSDKGRAIASNPNVCLSFFWPYTERQVIVRGQAEKVPSADSDAYFQSRPEGSQLGALVSDQSRVIPSREYLEGKLDAAEKKFAGREIPRPPDWGGYLVRPVAVEFWQGRENRLHDRLCYTREEGGNWKRERLAP